MKRLFHLDVMRVLAILAVVLMHCSGSIQQYYCADASNALFVTMNVFNAGTRYAVPLFLMISGSLMLGRDRDYPVLLKKSGHFMMVFLFWSGVYTLILMVLPYGAEQSMMGLAVNSIFEVGKGWFHFWYLFLICGIYCVLPFLEILVKHMPERLKRYYVVFTLISCFFMPLLLKLDLLRRMLGQHYDNFMVGVFGGFLLYFMLGYWLRDTRVNRPGIAALLLMLGLVYNAVVGSLTSAQAGERVIDYIDVLTPNTFLITVCIYLLCLRLREHQPSDRAAETVRKLSEWSFGVYLIHELVIEIQMRWFYPLIPNPWAAAVICLAVTLAVSNGLTALLMRGKRTRGLVK